jgi:hypothetical protein
MIVKHRNYLVKIIRWLLLVNNEAMRSVTLNKVIIWLIAFVGIACPWVIGVSVKLYLQSQGRPTWPWSYFFNPPIMALELWATLWFAAPFLVLAALGRLIFLGRLWFLDRFNDWERRLVILAGLGWGAVRSVRVFLGLFWELDPIVFMFAFLESLDYVGDIIIGLYAGICVATLSLAVRRLISRASS